MANKSVRGWCDCGATFSGSSSPAKAIEDIYVIFRETHDALGHHECDAKTAASVRRKQRAEMFAPASRVMSEEGNKK